MSRQMTDSKYKGGKDQYLLTDWHLVKWASLPLGQHAYPIKFNLQCVILLKYYYTIMTIIIVYPKILVASI